MQLADNHQGTMTKAFAGLRVLDFSTTIAGPHCARMLADMGAEVIKIETDEGETMRTRPPLRNGCSTVFGQLNVGKKSMVLDLKSPDGVEAIRRLVATADILVENFRPGVMHRLRLDYDTLRPLNPRLIYCSISGYGQTGPSSELPAYAPVIHAASGYDMAHLAHQPGRTRPDYCGIYHADVVTGTYAFGAVASALYQRTVTGEGQHLDVSMLESMLTLTVMELQTAQFEVRPPPRPMFGPTETADGYVMITISSEKSFQSLMKAIRRPEWISDVRFATYAMRRRNWGDMMDGVEAWSRAMTTGECLAALDAEGVPASAYRTVSEALRDPQLAHRQALSAVEDGGGSFEVLNLPFRMSGADVTPGKHMSVLGEHTHALLAEVGLADDEAVSVPGKAAAPG
jgi:crotonobetainyl-CoA:carnitine CoA-transferase CaiB-like acyl-CoA transferase